jgi:hypothetical protein
MLSQSTSPFPYIIHMPLHRVQVSYFLYVSYRYPTALTNTNATA